MSKSTTFTSTALKTYKTKFFTFYLYSIFFLYFGCMNIAHADNQQQSTKEIFNQYKARVAQIRIIDKATDAKTSIGSGFFVNATGLIATNYHVISKHIFEPNQYRIEFVLHDYDKTKQIFEAKLINFDVIHDLALLQTKPVIKTPFLEINTKNISKGENILSIGNPHDLGMAIILGTYNGITDDSMNQRIHLSGAINSGMSGGPSININGEVIGVNVATSGNQIGFLIPSHYLQSLIDNNERPSNFIEHVGKQILANQEKYLSAILDKPFKTKQLSSYLVPDNLASYLTCWGDSETKNLPYKTSGNSCATKDNIFLAEGFATGDIHYAQFHLTAKNLSKFRFAFVLEDYFANPGTHLTGSNSQFTKYVCKTNFVKNNNLTFKISFCLRGYQFFKNIYDMMLSAVTLNDDNDAIQTNLILSGVSYKNATLFSEKYLSAFSKVKSEGGK